MLLVDVPPRACLVVARRRSASASWCSPAAAKGSIPRARSTACASSSSSADKPYAKPGETVTLEALFTDARKDKPRAAKLYWIPVLCLNPKDDLYYLCFAPPGDGGRQAGQHAPRSRRAARRRGASAEAGAAEPAGRCLRRSAIRSRAFPPGVDLGPFLPQGPTFSFRMPDDAVKERPGSAPYGLAIVFNILCAGRVEFAARDPSGGAQQVPVLCTDENGVKLPPSDYVIGISRVYAYADSRQHEPGRSRRSRSRARTSCRPQGITVERCTAEKQRDCKENRDRHPRLGLELGGEPLGGHPRRRAPRAESGSTGTRTSESSTATRGSSSTRAQGRVPDSDVKYLAPKDPTDGTLWGVVHDNRGGAAWIFIPLHVR